MSPLDLVLTRNAVTLPAECRLSVLIPFYKESPSALLKALTPAGQPMPKGVEIILIDDGSADEALIHEVTRTIEFLPLPATLIRSTQNLGRAGGRNQMTLRAKGQYYLFLDSDMLPDRPDFLSAWLEHIAHTHPDVCFGGFSLDQAPRKRETALHRAFALHSDCVTAATRRLTPEKYVYTSNLLLKADLFASHGFDTAFTGWGWEDVEWAVRLSKRARIDHVDLSATHMGLDPAGTLISKYRQSVANFSRILSLHPEIVHSWGVAIWAQRLKKLPARPLWLKLFEAMARSEILPVRLRAMSLRLFRATLYAEVI